ncbi:hypothetical protein A2971_05165 [Candidatus Gottesmanbacteria bacterium RIFCSPLOWO2_01_FULL_46_21]|uniref:Polymerase nucleotidyl transferase domain-containing protein n=1 Tax=Candidatus Gottesmanbacteria bacterium RIFCSPLOWO2_01_FULL_46_21 TaxID=1798393 RepID=A0A1F6AYZ4_9BACT|nr:MAG: hypothetical protein A2971_05165 [Candidatus Gottesmanbacteria bacterium RIFCSPLOWO2_01_FULL_46_21]
MTQQTKQQLDIIVHEIVTKYQPEKIILFGSAVRGEQTPDSDIDLLIIKKTTDRPADRLYRVWHSLTDWDVPVDFSVYTPEEFRRAQQERSLFITDILHEGKTLYETS